MSRYRIKTLLNAVWTVLDAEFEATEQTISIEYRAREMALRNSIVETLDNPTFKGKRLVREVDALVQELIRMKRQYAQSIEANVNSKPEGGTCET